jgi:DNA-binding transcriptional regulator YhcF (GntR family)
VQCRKPVANQIKEQIFLGSLLLEDKLPSMREMPALLTVKPGKPVTRLRFLIMKRGILYSYCIKECSQVFGSKQTFLGET